MYHELAWPAGIVDSTTLPGVMVVFSGIVISPPEMTVPLPSELLKRAYTSCLPGAQSAVSQESTNSR